MRAKPKKKPRRVVLGHGLLIKSALAPTWYALTRVSDGRIKTLRRVHCGELGRIRLVAEVLK